MKTTSSSVRISHDGRKERCNFTHNVSIYSPKNDKAGALVPCMVGCSRSLPEAILVFVYGAREYQCHSFKMWPETADHTLSGLKPYHSFIDGDCY